MTKTWEQMLATEYIHEPAGSAWVSISSLPALEKCSFFRSRPGRSVHSQRGLALHAIMAGEPIPDDLPHDERQAIKEAMHKRNELCFQTGIDPAQICREAQVSENYLRIRGTCDVLYASGGRVMVADYKFGSLEVEPDSAQTAGYAICVSCVPADKVFRAIIQPGEPMKIIRSTIDADRQRVLGVLGKRERAVNPNCGYCADAATCPLMREVATTAEAKTDATEAIAKALEWAELVGIADKAASAYREQAKKMMRDGQPLPGWKLRISQVREISDLVSLYDMAKAVGVEDKDFLRACKTTLKSAKDALPQLTESQMAACTTTSERVSLVRA